MYRLHDFSRVGYDRHDHAPITTSLRGKVALVADGASPLGRAIGVALATLGARVGMVTGSSPVAATVRSEMHEEVYGCDVFTEVADMGLTMDVRELAKRIQDQEPQLDLLINNTAVMAPRRIVTSEGNELTVAHNVLGPFLLTNLLLPKLETGGGKVINVLSASIYAQRLDADDLQLARRRFRPRRTYAHSKRALAALTSTWWRRLRQSPVQLHATHPGLIDGPEAAALLLGPLRLYRAWLRTPRQGADTIIWAAATDLPHSGMWFDRAPAELHGSDATRETVAERNQLWDEVGDLTGWLG